MKGTLVEAVEEESLRPRTMHEERSQGKQKASLALPTRGVGKSSLVDSTTTRLSRKSLAWFVSIG